MENVEHVGFAALVNPVNVFFNVSSNFTSVITVWTLESGFLTTVILEMPSESPLPVKTTATSLIGASEDLSTPEGRISWPTSWYSHEFSGLIKELITVCNSNVHSDLETRVSKY